VEHTWVLICDASRARIFQYEKKDDPWTMVDEIDHPAGRAHVSDLVTDKRGRVQQVGGGGSLRPGMEPRTDPSDVEAERFAHRLGGLLTKAHDDHRCESVVLVAPPRFLGLLRKTLPPGVERSVSATIGKDYTQHESRDLQKRLVTQL